jgi:hypothetical protein
MIGISEHGQTTRQTFSTTKRQPASAQTQPQLGPDCFTTSIGRGKVSDKAGVLSTGYTIFYF